MNQAAAVNGVLHKNCSPPYQGGDRGGWRGCGESAAPAPVTVGKAAAVVALLIVVRHAGNIRRLLSGLTGRGATVLLTTHILEVAQRTCRRAGILHRGRLARELDIADLEARHADLAEIFSATVGAPSGPPAIGPGGEAMAVHMDSGIAASIWSGSSCSRNGTTRGPSSAWKERWPSTPR